MWTNFSWHELTEMQKRVVLIILGTLGVTLGIVLSLVMRTTIEQVKPVISQPVTTPRPSEAAARVVRQRLDAADTESLAALDPQIAAVQEFFLAARSRTRAYGDQVLSFESKWTLATDVFRSESQKEHVAFLETKFSETLFSKDELEQLVAQAVTGLLQRLQDIESQTLVKLQQDLEALPADSLPTVIDRAALQAKLSAALREASEAAQTELRAAVGLELASWVASEVLTMVGLQLGISSGIMGTGAATGWATLGVGLIVGIVVDAIVSEVYRQQFDPVSKIAGLLNERLSEMESLIVKGTKKSPGLELRLRDYTTRRNAARRQTIQHAVLAP